MVIFVSSIRRDLFRFLLFTDRICKLHFGLSQYYRVSGINLWPFVNNELKYLGSTILHLDLGIDTGYIICHIRPTINVGDNVHTIGCKIIQSSVASLIKIMDLLNEEKKLNCSKQWNVEERFYKRNDFNEDTLLKYKTNLENVLNENYIKQKDKKINLVEL